MLICFGIHFQLTKDTARGVLKQGKQMNALSMRLQSPAERFAIDRDSTVLLCCRFFTESMLSPLRDGVL
ncbi:hypothetical protein CA13_08830 [Planctomycetes bacterium CA13]|uniref:Uncharacterized protein n=1 Tax=Novipirellula herctigrandis TaxID=2527986 RepID=A0A5C5YWU5_9BACT|nr:hypothetical protein CA13_08830 [Planctomycetes bacterium CA13]